MLKRFVATAAVLGHVGKVRGQKSLETESLSVFGLRLGPLAELRQQNTQVGVGSGQRLPVVRDVGKFSGQAILKGSALRYSAASSTRLPRTLRTEPRLVWLSASSLRYPSDRWKLGDQRLPHGNGPNVFSFRIWSVSRGLEHVTQHVVAGGQLTKVGGIVGERGGERLLQGQRLALLGLRLLQLPEVEEHQG